MFGFGDLSLVVVEFFCLCLSMFFLVVVVVFVCSVCVFCSCCSCCFGYLLLDFCF